MGADYYTRQPNGVLTLNNNNVAGVSLARLIPQQGGLASHVTEVDITAGGTTVILHAANGDLAAPAVAGYPYQGYPPPVLSRDPGNGDINVFVNPRTDGLTGPDVTADGAAVNAAAVNNTSMTVSIVLDGERLFPQVTGSHTVPATRDLALTGVLPNPSAYSWTWDFGDGSAPGDGVTAHHSYTTPGTYSVQAIAEGANRSSGRSAAFAVTVTTAESTPPPTTPSTPAHPPGASHGNGGSLAPTDGPQRGDGPQIGGVPTDRPGSGPGGSGYRSAPPAPSATAGSTGSAPRVDGEVVGYLLGDATVVTAQPNPQAEVKPLDDAAPAARDGRSEWHLLSWIIATLAVASLLVVGVGSERRRPNRTPRRTIPRRVR